MEFQRLTFLERHWMVKLSAFLNCRESNGAQLLVHRLRALPYGSYAAK
jgi:hypothetical protein